MKKLIQSYLKVTALAAVHEASSKNLERNVWMLNSAGFKQTQMESILHADQTTISRILTGKIAKRKSKEKVSG